MKLKQFQKQDLARAALKDGLILAWDTGLGKTWALFTWPLLKVGFRRVGAQVCPNAPILIIAPGDLHQQIADEGARHFKVAVTRLDSQAAFERLTRCENSALTRRDEHNRPVLPPGFYITSYTQLASNGVARLPDPEDRDPRQLLAELSLPIGEHRPLVQASAQPTRHGPPVCPSPASVCDLFAQRALRYRDHYDILAIGPLDSRETLERAYEGRQRSAQEWRNPKAAAAFLRKLAESRDLLRPFHSDRGRRFADLEVADQDAVIREFLKVKLAEYAANIGLFKPEPAQVAAAPASPGEGERSPAPKIKCLYSPSLADLCYNAFTAVVIDEGVKMKGEETIIGKGVRQMDPQFRLVLSATPIKNRLPDVFRLAWWATGGKPDLHARFPYADSPAEREKFSATFMVTERNLTAEAKAREEGEKASASRFTKLTPEVCNIHRLWKLFGPIILRRRKQDAGEEIVPRLRRVIRVPMGTLQQKVYQYHLDADYLDKNGRPAVGAQLQALRIAAADPSSQLLDPQPGQPDEPCSCSVRTASGPPLAACSPSPDDGMLALASPRGEGERPPASLHDAVHCPQCRNTGRIPLPHRSAQPFIPKMNAVLSLIKEILERKEQVLIGSAFNDPLDSLSRWLTDAGVRHVTLDGRVSQKGRGVKAAVFKAGRESDESIPVMLAGVECMAEGHSFNLANNVVLLAYSWAYDKFKQFLDRVHRMNSVRPVNVYVVICDGTIDRKLESLVQEKGDAAELVLDGRLIGERADEVNLAELLQIARSEFARGEAKTIDEATLSEQWPNLRAQLQTAAAAWDEGLPAKAAPVISASQPRSYLDLESLFKRKSETPMHHPAAPIPAAEEAERPVFSSPSPGGEGAPLGDQRHDPLARLTQPVQTPAPASFTDWRARVRDRAARLAQRTDLWSLL